MIALSMPAERRSAQVFSGIDGADFRGLRGDVEALAQSSAVAFSTSVRKTVHAPVPSSTPRALVLMFTLLASELWAHRRTCKQPSSREAVLQDSRPSFPTQLSRLLRRLAAIMIALSMPAERRSAQVFSGIDGADFRGLRGDVEALAQSSAVAVSTSVRKTVHASVPVSGRLCMYRYLPRLPGPWLSCCKQLAAGKLCCRTAALRFRHSCRDFCEGLRPFMIALSMPAERP